MGRLEVNGLDALTDDFAALAQLPDKVVEDILDAAAEVITAAQREEIKQEWRGPHSLDISAKSVKKGDIKKSADGHSIYIYPQGTRKRGRTSTRNAEIAFINEYGKKGQPARPAIQTANKRKESAAIEAGEKAYNKYLDSKNL